MVNKMEESRMSVGTIASSINFPKTQKISVQYKKIKIKSAKAFSIAEAMIALLIGTIILGFSAPMISKQLKQNDLTNIQTQIINSKIERLERLIENSRIPVGSIIFLDSNRHNGCPDGWTMLNQEGKFFKITTVADNVGLAEGAFLPDHSHAIGKYTGNGASHSEGFFKGNYTLYANNSDLRLFAGAANGVNHTSDMSFVDMENNENGYSMQYDMEKGLITSLNIFDDFSDASDTFIAPTNNFGDLQPQSYSVFACRFNPS